MTVENIVYEFFCIVTVSVIPDLITLLLSVCPDHQSTDRRESLPRV